MIKLHMYYFNIFMNKSYKLECCTWNSWKLQLTSVCLKSDRFTDFCGDSIVLPRNFSCNSRYMFFKGQTVIKKAVFLTCACFSYLKCKEYAVVVEEAAEWSCYLLVTYFHNLVQSLLKTRFGNNTACLDWHFITNV